MSQFAGQIPLPVSPSAMSRDADFKSAQPIAKWAIAFLIIDCVVILFALEATYGSAQIFRDLHAGRSSALIEAAGIQEHKRLLIDLGRLAMFVPTAIAFTMWTYRVYKNLWAISPRPPRFKAGRVAASFYIPIINFYRPYLAMRETYELSDSHLRGGSRVVVWWWWCWVSSQVLIRYAQWQIKITMIEDMDRLYRMLYIETIGDALLIAAAVFATTMIFRIDRLQGLAISHIDYVPPDDRVLEADLLTTMVEHPDVAIAADTVDAEADVESVEDDVGGINVSESSAEGKAE